MNLIKTQTADTWFPFIADEIFRNSCFFDDSKLSINIPAVNVKELDKQFTIEIAAPGQKKHDFEIELENNLITISSSTNTESEDLKAFTRREFSLNAFKRSFTLPDSVDNTKIKADYSNGILSINLPKRKEVLPQPKKRIAIN